MKIMKEIQEKVNLKKVIDFLNQQMLAKYLKPALFRNIKGK